MKVRSTVIYKATQYKKAGDHPLEHISSISTQILEEEPGKPWPKSGRLSTLDECDPKDLRYAVFASKDKMTWFDLKLGDWILEVGGVIVKVVSNEKFHREYQELA